MLLEEYRKALRQGLKEVKAAAAAGKETGLLVLPDNMEAKAIRRESLGVVEIPMELIDGTYNTMRRDDFSPGFYPVVQEESEFASKWEMLCKAHMDEGIRDPIKAVEYLHHFYVIEGHKRVSVLKHFGAISVPGTVTRLYPPHSDDPEVVAYYEFLNFYQMTGLSFLVFRRPGEYQELLEAVGMPGRDPWSAEDVYRFRSFYYMFRDAYLRRNMDPNYVAQAFLVYIQIFGYRASREKMTSQILKELPKIRQEILNRLENAGTTVLLEDTVRRPIIFPMVTMPAGGKLCVAFLHGSSPSTSRWEYGHEYGRYSLENNMTGQIRTLSYENVDTEEKAEEAFESAVNEGAGVIFTTTPKLMLPSVKQAVLHPDVKILNCSLNTTYPSVRTYYPRLYEATFIKGAIAATLTTDNRIGFVADYPTFGNIASINAFAQGARMVNANATIYLTWDTLREGGGLEELHEMGILYIDRRGRLAAHSGRNLDGAHNLALAQIRWGKFYLSIVRRVLEGSWKKELRGNSAINYWWGMNQGVVDVLCSRSLPIGTRRLVSVLRTALQAGRLDPFYGLLMSPDQDPSEDSAPPPAEQILSMNWLSPYVQGRIPAFEELTESAQELVKLQGVERRAIL